MDLEQNEQVDFALICYFTKIPLNKRERLALREGVYKDFYNIPIFGVLKVLFF